LNLSLLISSLEGSCCCNK